MLFLLLGMAFIVSLTGCFEITQETTINDNGSGIYKNTTDLSTLIGMAKMMGGEGDLKKMGGAKDTTVSLTKMADSVQGITEKEKAMLKKGSLNIQMDMDSEKMLVSFIFPYSSPNDISQIALLMKKIRTQVMNSQMNALANQGDEAKMMGEGISETTEIDEFFDIVYTNGKLSKKINKEKYANVNSDKGLKSLQEMSQMGSPMTVKTVINLPRPAKKIEAKGAEISADKKKITVSATIDDLFDDPRKFEYLIEY